MEEEFAKEDMLGREDCPSQGAEVEGLGEVWRHGLGMLGPRALS